MPLKETLFQDFKNAMKNKDILRKNTIQSVRTAVLQVEKDDQVDLSDEDVINIIMSQIKKRKSALPDYEKSGREDLVAELKQEISILEEYLPQQLSDEELTDIINETVEEVGASTMKDMGKVMSAVIPKVQGRADNKRISIIVKNALA